MSIKLRIIADQKKDIIRDLALPNNLNLEELHYAIGDAFELIPGEMASFYKTDSDWNQLDEIPLVSFGKDDDNCMKKNSLLDTFTQKFDRLLYVYDFLNMKTFYVESYEVGAELIMQPILLQSVGKMPEEENQVPDLDLESIFEDEFKDPLDDDYGNDFNNLENIDDYDF